jgi:coenzyme PQQ precursor peptide PqqA
MDARKGPAAILRDTVLRTAPQDEGSAIGYCNERYRGFALLGNTAIAIGYCNNTYRTASYLQKFGDRAKSNSFKQAPIGGARKEESMAWTTPTLVEICIGLEINGYLPAEF